MAKTLVGVARLLAQCKLHVCSSAVYSAVVFDKFLALLVLARSLAAKGWKKYGHSVNSNLAIKMNHAVTV